MLFCLSKIRSEEFPGEIEAEVETVREAATRELSERRPLAVVDVELKQVTAGPFLDREPVGGLVGTVPAGAGRYFSDEVHRGTHSHTAADTHEESVAIDVQDRGCVVNPDWCRVYREPVGDHSRNGHAQRGRIVFLEVVCTFHRDESRERNRERIALTHGVVLAVELKGLVDRRAIDSGLQVPRDTEPVLEADRRSLIEPEQIARVAVEAALAEDCR